MATDTRRQQQMTLAELCEAIAEGQVQYTVKDGEYQVKRGELRRLRADREHEAIPVELLHGDDTVANLNYPG